jgi:ribonuclease HI
MEAVIYTDGACIANGKTIAKGGYGIYIKQSKFGNDLKIGRKGEHMSFNNGETTFYVTNIRMEGLAIVTSLFLMTEAIVYEKEIGDPVEYLNANFNTTKMYKVKYGEDELKHGEPKNKNFEIITDSKFWIDVIKSWMPSWIKKNILLTKKNPDLLLMILYYVTILKQNGVKLTLTHVHSHQKGTRTSNADGNDVADVIATEALKNKTDLFEYST